LNDEAIATWRQAVLDLCLCVYRGKMVLSLEPGKISTK